MVCYPGGRALLLLLVLPGALVGCKGCRSDIELGAPCLLILGEQTACKPPGTCISVGIHDAAYCTVPCGGHPPFSPSAGWGSCPPSLVCGVTDGNMPHPVCLPWHEWESLHAEQLRLWAKYQVPTDGGPPPPPPRHPTIPPKRYMP